MSDNIADLKGKKVLFIAYYYPPEASTGEPGAMRTVKFIRNLINGESHVLTTTPLINEFESALSHVTLPVNNERIYRVQCWDIFKLLLSLRAKLKNALNRKPSNNAQESSNSPPVFKSNSNDDEPVNISRFQEFKDFIYNLCYFPDQAGPWIFPAYFEGKKQVKKQGIDVIFATGSPWSGLLTGYLISKATGIPLIADFRDPWMNNPFHQSKGKCLDNWSARLEKKVVEHASAISLNTEPLREEFLQRYPYLNNDRFFVMPNGFDKQDFIDIEAASPEPNSDLITLCHAGFLYGLRDPSVLLDAIQAANIELKTHGKKIRFVQIGDVQLSYDIRERYDTMIDDHSLELQEARPYQDCLRSLSSSDWVVNVQPATKSQVPSKLYDYLAINRPILNITPKDGALGQLVNQHKLGELFGFRDQAALTSTLVNIALNDDASDSFKGYAARPKFDYEEIAKLLANRISEVTG